ncbi:unnamed protein product [Mytilus coruscus]|uniref:Uncharacterized protein n=1 Tax=Mytilus coruscus TaxID=42192 RepID=A0A6J8EBP9_MYTCO|nr:unnamed protein product [Mytilus coruscus]
MTIKDTCFVLLNSENPRGFNNQKLQCTITQVDRTTNKLFVKAEQCGKQHSVLYEISAKEFSVFDDNNYTYAMAQKKCNILDYYSVKDSLSLQNIMFEGKSYWTNVLRFSTEGWVDNTSDIDALKDITKAMRNQICLSASQIVGFPPAVRQLPCNNFLPFRCSPVYTPLITDAALNTGDESKLSLNNIIPYQPTIPCFINYNEDDTSDYEGRSQSSVTSYKVSIYTPWMIHIG